MSHQKRVLRPIRSDVAPPVTSPPVYRGDIDTRGAAQDLVPRSFWVDFWDTLFFIFAGVAALVLTFMILANTVGHSFWGVPIAFIFWAVTAYLTLPRFHAIMTRIYVPDYFIGRTRTPDGLLGDPVNIGLIGTEEQIHQVMQDAGWTRADDVTLVSSWKIILSTITRRSYAEAPVSPLKIFGKTQAFAYQKEVDGNPEKRHHVRFWKTPDGWLLPGGHQVDWLAAGTYDSGVGFSFFTLQVTHRIDAETDFERDYIVESIQYAHPETHVEILHDFSSGYHARNGGGGADRVRAAVKRQAIRGTVSYDPNIRPALLGTPDEARPHVEAIVALADVVKASDEDLKWLYPDRPVEDVLREWSQSGPSLILCTRGPWGVYIKTAAERDMLVVDPLDVELVDTVGAGDSLMAGLISGLVDAGLLGSAEAKQRLREASWDQILPAIHRGIITSGITILYQGAYSPTREEVNEILAADKTLRG